MTDTTREAAWAETMPDADGDSYYWKVGVGHWNGKSRGDPVTRISVQCDLPALHCNMWRVCVWVGETLVAEAPLHNLKAVGY